MGRITSSTGLFSGVPIVDTVDKLIELQARPRDLLVSRGKDLQAKQVAVTDLTAAVIAIQLAAKNLGRVQTFQQKAVTSSNANLLTAVATNNPAVGDYRFTAVRQATAQHLLTTGFASQSEPLGAGELTFQYGGFVDEGLPLSELNGGAGVARGKIRITDRSGASAIVDLRFAQTIDDVLQAINTTDAIQVKASVVGDRLTLTDQTGSTSNNLRVVEVSGGSTAADLGLASINVAADTAQGDDILRLYGGLQLGRLNDGNGLSIRSQVSDLNVTFRDGTSLALDFHRQARAADFATATTTGDPDAQITFTAKTVGADFDQVRIVFQANGGVTQGNETVVYDDSNPNDKTLTFQIAADATTADDIINALNNDPTAGAIFGAARATGSDGSGVVTASQTGVTAGGAAQTAREELSLEDLLQTINAADPTRLQASLSASGDRLVLTDLTANLGGTFVVTDTAGGSLAADLGLANTASGATLTGGRLLGGLRSTLLHSLNGGQGFGELGSLTLTDRSGASATVNLSSAETLDDIIAAINATNIGVEASINSARNGLEIRDTTGALASNFKIVSADATDTAETLKINVDAAVASKSSGSLGRQTISENTLLSSLNGGKGVARRSFIITDAAGIAGVVNLNNDNIQTVGDVIDAINALTNGVEARLSPAGDGLQVFNTAAAAGTLTIRDSGTGTAAKDLNLTGTAQTVTIDGQPRQAITGSAALRVTVSATDTLTEVVAKINALGGGFAASILNDGTSTTPFRLSLQSQTVGRAGSLVVDSSYGLHFTELSAGQDALLQVGGGIADSAGILVASTSNTFVDVVPGLSLTLTGSSNESVNIHVAASDSSLISAVNSFVDQYNKTRDKLATYTAFNETDKSSGPLFGSLEALRIDSELSSLLTGRFFGVGDIQSLRELGLDMTEGGKLTFDSAKFQEQYAAAPQAVTEFFTKETVGFVAKVDRLMESFAGVGNSLLLTRVQSLQSRIENYTARIDVWNRRLDRGRELLLKKFLIMETAIGKLQNSMNAINAIQPLPSLISPRR